MKKKLLTIVLSAVLCLGSSMTVMAATSPSTTTAGPSATVTVNGETVTVGVKQTTVDASILEEVNYADEASCISFVQEKTGTQVAAMSIHGMTDVSLDGTLTDEQWAAGVSVTFSAPGVSSGSPIVVLHKRSSDGVWETIQATAGDGVITGIFHSLSPVFYYVPVSDHYHNYTGYETAPTATTWGYTTYICECGDTYYDNYVAPLGTGAAGTSAAAAGAVSPKTAESNAPYAMAVIALAAMAGLVVTSRKYSVNR